MIGLDLDNQVLDDRFELFGRISAEVGEDLFVARDIRAQGITVLIRLAYMPPGVSPATHDAPTDRLSREFELANSIEHPNVVAVVEGGRAADRSGTDFQYLAYEYLAGG